MSETICASSCVSVKNVALLRDTMLENLRADGAIVIDIAGVTDADLSLIQLLAALRVSAADAGREVRLRTPVPAPVAALLDRAGFLAAPTPQDLDFWFHGETAQ